MQRFSRLFRFVVPCVVLILICLFISNQAIAAGSPYTLHIEGKGVCVTQGRVDPQSTKATIKLKIPDNGGPVNAKGKYDISGKDYHLSGPVVIKGRAKDGILTFPFPDYYNQGKIMPKAVTASPIKLKIESGSKYVQDYVCDYKLTYRLTAPPETWQVTYTGYQVLYFGSNRHVGGQKAHWRTTVEFIIEDGKYKSGNGKNEILKLDNYTFPPGVWDCVSLKEYPKIEQKTFSVSGVKTGSTVRLILPKRNNGYYLGYTCIMDTDALKNYYRTKGYTEFPSLKGTRKNRTETDEFGLFPSAFHDITLAEYEKVIENDKFQGYKVRVRKLK